MKPQKITLQVPKPLLQKAMAATGQGITQTIKKGLEIVAAQRAYEELRKYRGKIKFSVDFKKLREE